MEQDFLEYIDQIKNTTDYFAKAKLITFLVRQKKMKVKDLASALSIKPSYLCHIMRLSKLSEIIMDGYYSELISMSHLFVISLLHSEEDIMEVYEMVLRDSLTVLQTEELVRTKLHGVSSEGEYIQDVVLDRVRSKLKDTFKADAKIVQTRIKTKVIIEWKGSRGDRKKDVERFLRLIEGQLGTD
ncbi:MAG: hypothetical protein WAV30_04385 [Microgenomates group bacterium]